MAAPEGEGERVPGEAPPPPAEAPRGVHHSDIYGIGNDLYNFNDYINENNALVRHILRLEDKKPVIQIPSISEFERIETAEQLIAKLE